jgi:hypothetical protein
MRRHDAPRKSIGAVTGNGPDPGTLERRQNVRAQPTGVAEYG